jgi:hypothetical protein
LTGSFQTKTNVFPHYCLLCSVFGNREVEKGKGMQELTISQVHVAYTYNLSYLGGQDQEYYGWRSTLANSL